MEVRKLKENEHILHRGISVSVFHDMKRQDIREMMETPLDHKEEVEASRWGCFDEDGTLRSAAISIPFDIKMNHNTVKMGGIGNVVTRPQSRGKGLVNKIFKKIFDEMYENNQIFSFLYPFSFEYYRKFGYEICLNHNEWTIPTTELSKFPYPKNVQAFEPGDDLSPYIEIHKEFMHDRNWSVVRSPQIWQDTMTCDPYKNLEFIFLIRDEKYNMPIGYISYKAIKNSPSEDGVLEIKEMFWTAPRGLRQLLGFIGKLSPEFKTVKWTDAPGDLNLHALGINPYSINLSVKAACMGRIVNVKAALETLTAPSFTNADEVAIKVIDDYYPINTGRYEIKWDKGRVTVSRVAVLEAESDRADMEVTVGTLAQLVSGYMSLQEAALKPSTILTYKNEPYYDENIKMLEILFPKKQVYLIERF